MGKSEQARQKKLAKKRTKQIANRKKLASEKNAMKSVAGQIAAATRGSFYRCYIYNSLLETGSEGIGAVFVGRFVPDGRIVFAAFLIDRDCLGVKNAFAQLLTPSQFSDRIEQTRERVELRVCDPAMAKKCVTDSVRWAGQFGLQPHPDFDKINAIWPDVDESQCDRTFDFGRDGKPFYIQGPNDSPAFVTRVLEILSSTAGDGNFDFVSEAEQFGGLQELSSIDGETLMGGKEIILPDGSRLVGVDGGE